MLQSATLTGRPAARRRAHKPLTLALILLALVVVLLASASASPAGSARPGKPTAKTPKGIIVTTTPTFTWGKVKGAVRYELRVYEGDTQRIKKIDIKTLSYTSNLDLTENVDHTWKVRAGNAGGAGPWSKSLAFRVAPDSLKAITDFRFAQPYAVADIDETRHTIDVIVPAGTDPSALVATFVTSGAAVAAFGAPQVSGVTPNDFAFPVLYTVTARDGSTQDYVVAAFALEIGDLYRGGIVSCILQAGDPGFVAGETHGLIAAVADQSAGTPGVIWSTIGSVPAGGSQIRPAGPGQTIGTGQSNTTAIVCQTATIDGQYVECTGGAAYLCDRLSEGGYDDWFLPSKDELNKLYLNRDVVGGYAPADYWSSSDNYELGLNSATAAWSQHFGTGVQGHWGKYFLYRVRAVRVF